MNNKTEIGVFFDLDKTLIHGATLLIFAPLLHKNGLIKTSTLIRAGIGAKIFEHLGANERRMKKMKRVGIKIAHGWNRDEIVSLTHENLKELITPRVYAEAKKLIAWHNEQGHIITIVSSSPIELVQPIAKLLGIENVIATKIVLNENGCCTTEFESYIYSESKPEEVQAITKKLGIDLDQSYAYSDSVTDLPLLNCVGNPNAVNPDKKLAVHAKANGWKVLNFARPQTMGDTLTTKVANSPWSKAVAAGVGAVAVGASTIAISRSLNPPQPV